VIYTSGEVCVILTGIHFLVISFLGNVDKNGW
jgi:hypothetical protein